MAHESTVQAVQRTWAVVAQNLEGTGIAFFKELFNTSHPSPPGYEEFSIKRLQLFQSQAFKRHALNVMNTINVAVMSLNDLDSLVPVLKGLGAKHAKMWGITDRHYDLVAIALLNTLHKALGDQWTPAVKEAWTSVFTTVATSMKSGAVAA
mmetsp:Transcript_19166/g.50077  ORF Transcript_19166/g.50077 Transcript_19166/m.50077 type:complete len:151 (-) Transcript_19166:52-504(-)|eukprot:jgi/Tetstr1/449293/TSEL_003808.t1